MSVGAARPAQGLQDAPDHRRGGRQGHRSSRWAAISAARSSPAWRGSTACRWLLLASDPFHYGGAWTADACQKVVRFVDLAETFHLPVVYLMDCPGFMIGLEAEKQRHHPPRRARDGRDQPDRPCPGARSSCATPSAWPARRTSRPAGLSLRYAWLSAYWGSLPLEGGIEAAYRAEIDAAPDPKAKLAEIEARLNALRSPFRTRRDASGSRRSSTRATRARCCASSRGLAEPLRTPGHARFAMRP